MRIEPVTLDTVEEARQVIFTGFLDYFSEIDYSLNPDLHNVLQTYSEKGNMFVVGAVEKKIVCTGALYKEDEETARICRVSVLKDYRQRGLARQIVHFLEEKAYEWGYKQIVIETNLQWGKPIGLYKSLGYITTGTKDNQIHFRKHLM
ncbi:GNAT family N-acetyltransferase [Bacillus sp. DX1.1]|uniref:GNAT family N-acetyltransferase n=1 Tax=unclassified Bacillus (in: firmicutes) TaxID=185979 RepID=UPI0025708E3A|nr:MULTISPECIES: GNAT family N-acetyltransferase [unclassified Bacillus (in: firmicutes)]MDM5155183.1 GNAT family N-acetyltransferase [Bacillus sp. DX1.1]WJE79508.1 GNAT family N-acetyltransferase [Bacillus sp. DX3.1]